MIGLQSVKAGRIVLWVEHWPGRKEVNDHFLALPQTSWWLWANWLAQGRLSALLSKENNTPFLTWCRGINVLVGEVLRRCSDRECYTQDIFQGSKWKSSSGCLWKDVDNMGSRVALKQMPIPGAEYLMPFPQPTKWLHHYLIWTLWRPLRYLEQGRLIQEAKFGSNLERLTGCPLMETIPRQSFPSLTEAMEKGWHCQVDIAS